MARIVLALLVLALVIGGFFLFRPGDHDLIVYSGRSKALVEPIIEQFEDETGIRVRVRYGETAQLAVAIMEEGSRTPADLFWAQDAGALGALSAEGLFTQLPANISERLPAMYRNSAGTWVATSGRARVLAYSPQRVTEVELPNSVFDLADPRWRGRIGWAPTNGSFQSFVTAMHTGRGVEKTRLWLAAVKQNGAKSYSNNNALIQAIAAGEIDVAITNHYYLLRAKSTDPNFPVAQTFFQPGDIGNLVNVAGVGIVAHTDEEPAARRFIQFLLDEEAQSFFAHEVNEYPVINSPQANPVGLSSGELEAASPQIDLDALRDLEETLGLLREAGLL